MKTSTLVIGGVVLLVIAGGIFYTTQYMGSSTNATSTVSTITDTNQVQQNNTVTQVPGVPVVTTNSLVAPTGMTAVVTGTVIPMGANTAYWYEYGITSSFGQKTSNVRGSLVFSPSTRPTGIPFSYPQFKITVI